MAGYFIADVHKPIGEKDMQLHDPHDYASVRDLILNNVKTSIQQRYPLENDRYRLELSDVDYDSNKPFTRKEQKKAILNGGSLTRKLMGNWRLVDKASNQVISKTKRQALMNVPYLTERGTYIRNGNEAILPIQMRLVSGVFARKKDNGELEAHVNVKPGSGRLFKINMDPKTGVFYLGVGAKNLKL